MPESAFPDSAQALARPDLWLAPEAPFLPWGRGAHQLAQYMDMLLKWNKVLNLSGCHDPLALLGTLIQDSFFLAHFLDALELPSMGDICDLGAGAGLPGIPLRIFWQQGNYNLVERSGKRSMFLQNVLASMNLPNTEVYREDADAYLRQRPRAMGVIISRAFKPWPELLRLCGSALMSGGQLIIMANAAPPAAFPKPWRLGASLAYEIPGAKIRWLWAIAPGAATHVQSGRH